MLRTDAAARAATKALAAFPREYSPTPGAPRWHLLSLAPVVRKGTHDAAWYHMPGTELYLYVVMETPTSTPYAPGGGEFVATPRWQDVRTCDDVSTLAQWKPRMTADQKAVAAALDPRLAQMWEGKREPIIERAKRVVARAYKGREWPWWARYHLLGEDVPANADPADRRARTHPAAV